MVYKNKILALLAISIILAISYFLIANLLFTEEAEEVSTIEKTLRFTFTLKNNSSDHIPLTHMISNLPLTIKNRQEISSIGSETPFEIIGDKNIDPQIKLEISDFSPHSTKIINLLIKINKSSAPYKTLETMDLYLKSEKYIEINSDPVKSIAEIIEVENSPFLIYQWLDKNIENIGYTRDNRGAEFALKTLAGDCTEHMYAFMAIARNKGIPARGFSGFYSNRDITIATSSLYHNWAEFQDRNVWRITDSNKQIFDNEYQNYIAYRLIGGEEENSQFTSRFMLLDSRISVEF